MKQKGLGLGVVLALVLGMSMSVGATVCEEEDAYGDFRSGVNVSRIDWWANLLQEIPIDVENLEVSLPLPEDFPIELDSDLLNMLEPLIVGVHTFDFTLHTVADLVNEAEYAVTTELGQVTIALELGQPGGAPYLEADVSFGNVTHDCSMFEWWEVLSILACEATGLIFDTLIENESVYFTIDTIGVTQVIDTCVVQTNGVCEAVAEVSSTTVTHSGFQPDTEFGNFMDLLIGAITEGMVTDFIKLAFSPDGEMSTLVMLWPYLITQADGCSPPPEVAACSGSACSTTQQAIMKGSSRRITNVALYVLPAAILLGLIIRRRKK